MSIQRRSILNGLAGGAATALLPGLDIRPAFGAPKPKRFDSAKVKAEADKIFPDLMRPTGNAKGMIVGVTYPGAGGKPERGYFSYGDVPLHQSGGSVAIKDVVMFIGSCTKVFTGTMLALAALNGKLGPDIKTPVSAFLPTSTKIGSFQGVPIRLWHLASNCAGFPGGPCGPQSGFGDYPFSSLECFLNAFTPGYGAGEYYLYSNQGFILLGALLSHANIGGSPPATWDSSYQQWAHQVVSLVTRPLKMPNTVVDYQQRLGSRVAQGFTVEDSGDPKKKGELKEVPPPTWNLASAGLPAGALCSTAEDMLTFLEAQINPPNGALGGAISMSQNSVTGKMKGMGLGWQIGNGYLCKDGGFGGYTAYMDVDLEAEIGVIILCNTFNVGQATIDGGRRLLAELRKAPLQPLKETLPPPPPEESTPRCPNSSSCQGN